MDANQSLELIRGDLRAYAQIVPGTFQHVDQLTQACITDPDLCKVWLYTADGNAYQPKKRNSVLWGVTREQQNLILTHLFDEQNSSFDQLVQNGNFIPDSVESARALDQGEVFDLTKLRLQGDDATYRFLQIRTADGYVYDGKKFVQPNVEEKRALTRIGFTDNYLTFLSDNTVRDIETTNLYVLNPAYVRKEAEGGKTLWRASWLGGFNGDSNFNAIDRKIYINDRLRGVRREASVSESSAPAGADAKNLVAPSLEDVLACLDSDVAPSVRPAIEGRIRKLYMP